MAGPNARNTNSVSAFVLPCPRFCGIPWSIRGPSNNKRGILYCPTVRSRITGSLACLRRGTSSRLYFLSVSGNFSSFLLLPVLICDINLECYVIKGSRAFRCYDVSRIYWARRLCQRINCRYSASNSFSLFEDFRTVFKKEGSFQIIFYYDT